MKKLFTIVPVLLLFISQTYAQQNSNLSVSATVPAQPTDYQVQIIQTDPSSATHPEDTVITYQITYGSTLSSPSNINLEAEWSLGTIEGSGTPTVTVLSYQTGSASNAYGSTPPVIDTVNRKITWSINNYPANTGGQTVTFQLKTTSNYTADFDVDFELRARVHGLGVTTSDSIETGTYHHSGVFPTPTPTNTPTPTITPTPITGVAPTGSTSSSGSNPTPSNTPTPAIVISETIPLSIDLIEVVQKSDTQATIEITTNIPSNLTLIYGNRTNNLPFRVNQIQNSTLHRVILENLTPDTQYFFRATASNNNETITSDIFTFTTASKPPQSAINLSTLIVTSLNKIIFEQSIRNILHEDLVILTKTTPFEIKFSVENPRLVKRAQALIRSKNVLGANSSVIPSENIVELVEIQPGTFYGRLSSNQVIGNYELYVRIEDTNGNIFEEKVSDIKVISYLKVTDSNNLPINGAEVKWYVFDYSQDKYVFISNDILTISNPSYSERDGNVHVILPPGKYKAEVSSFGYKTEMVEFEIGSQSHQVFPVVKLKSQPINAITILNLGSKLITAGVGNLFDLIKELGQNSTLFKTLNWIIVIVFSLLLLIASSSRFSIHIANFPFLLYYHVLDFLGRKHTGSKIISGKVMDETNKAISGVLIYISNSSNLALTHTKTNSFGEFYCRVKDLPAYKLSASKKGYSITKARSFNQKDINDIKIQLKKLSKPLVFRTKDSLVWYGREILSSLFEAILVIGFALEILFAYNFGLTNALPFLTFSVLNLLLFLFYRKHEAS